MNLISRLRIPTLLGLGVIVLGMGAGIYTVVQNQTSLLTKASPDQSPKNITITNIEDTSVSISWQTAVKVSGFITYGLSSLNEQTVLDDKDNNVPSERMVHHITLKNLTPQTTHTFKIFSGKQSSEMQKFTTAALSSSQNDFSPVIGSVLEGDQPLKNGMVYLSIPGAVIQSSIIKDLGNFVIPLSKVRKQDLSDILKMEEGLISKLTVVSENGQASTLFRLTSSSIPLGPLKIGQDLDLTETTPSASSTSSTLQNIYDLNNDKLVNVADYSLSLKNKGNKIKAVRPDLDTDRVIDQKYLDEFPKEVNQEYPKQ